MAELQWHALSGAKLESTLLCCAGVQRAARAAVQCCWLRLSAPRFPAEPAGRQRHDLSCCPLTPVDGGRLGTAPDRSVRATLPALDATDRERVLEGVPISEYVDPLSRGRASWWAAVAHFAMSHGLAYMTTHRCEVVVPAEPTAALAPRHKGAGPPHPSLANGGLLALVPGCVHTFWQRQAVPEPVRRRATVAVA